MSKENIPKVYVGIDISKDHLDVCLMTGDQRLTLNNDAKGLDQLTERLSKEDSPLIVMEATGGYDVPIAAALLSKGLPAAIVNPKRVIPILFLNCNFQVFKVGHRAKSFWVVL